MSFADFRPRVQQLVRDGAGVLADPGDYDFSLEEAVKRYSRVRPKVWVVDVDGTGAFDYPLPAPWDDGFSRLLDVEYPAGQREPEYVDALDRTVYETPAGPALRFLADTPAEGETIRVRFTGQHTIAEVTTTVPAADQHAVIYLAAALACEQLASHYSNANDPTIQADAVDHKSKASEYALRAKRFMTLATELLPIKEMGEVQAAGGETSWGEQMGLLTHPER